MEANFTGDLIDLRYRKGEEGKRRQNVACLEKESLSPGDPGPLYSDTSSVAYELCDSE